MSGSPSVDLSSRGCHERIAEIAQRHRYHSASRRKPDRMTLGVDFSLDSQLSLAAFLGQLAFLMALLVLAFVAKRWFRA